MEHTNLSSNGRLVYSSHLDYAKKQPTIDISTNYEEFVEYRPVTSLETNDSTIDIEVSEQEYHFYDLQRSSLFVRLKLTDSADVALASGVDYMGANNLLYSLFKNIVVYFNERIVYNSENNYSYRCLIENLISKEGKDLSIGFYDEAEDGEPTQSETQARKTNFAQSKLVELQGPLISDLLSINRLIPNKTIIRIRLERNPAAFSFMSHNSTAVPKIKIQDLYVKMMKVGLSPPVYKSITSLLDHHDTFLPITRTCVKTFVVPKDSYGTTVERIFTSQVPRSVIVGFVKAESYRGGLGSNPFNFQTLAVTKIGVSSDDGPSPPTWQQFDFASGKYLDGYNSLRSIINNNKETLIDKDKYLRGKTLFGFQLSHKLDKLSQPVLRIGNTRLEVTLSTALTEAYIGIAFAQFDGKLGVTKNREYYYQE